MQNNEIESKMMRQVGISLEALNWFILSTFIKSIVTDPDKVTAVFASAEDCQAIEGILARINKQFAPNIDKVIDTSEERLHLESILQLSPDSIIETKKSLIL